MTRAERILNEVSATGRVNYRGGGSKRIGGPQPRLKVPTDNWGQRRLEMSVPFAREQISTRAVGRSLDAIRRGDNPRQADQNIVDYMRQANKPYYDKYRK